MILVISVMFVNYVIYLSFGVAVSVVFVIFLYSQIDNRCSYQSLVVLLVDMLYIISFSKQLTLSVRHRTAGKSEEAEYEKTQ